MRWNAGGWTVVAIALTAVSGIGWMASRTALQEKPSRLTWKKTPYADKLGLELDGIGDGSRSMPFVDVARTLRPFTKIGGADPAPTDKDGWPTADCQSVLFDIRPVPAWAPPIDDPDAFQPDWSGTYKLALRGQAKLGLSESGGTRIVNQQYHAAKNLTTADVIVAKGTGLLILTFAKTKRQPSDPEGTGFTQLRLIRPGYPADTQQVFTNEFLRALKPFRVLRYMDWLDTNHNPGYYGDPGHHALHWADRRRPSDATQQTTGDKYGIAWEYCIELANTTGTDLWINIPVAATDDYVKQLAELLKRRVKPELAIYIEHSNEVWNFGFPQYTYNKLAAIDEVKKGQSPLNNDNCGEEERFAHRRHAKRLYEISRIFRSVFGETERFKRIRPVYASWLIQPDTHYRDVLKWFAATYGPPKNSFYAIASAAYYNAEKASPTASPREILDAMRQSSDANRKYHEPLRAIADSYGLKYAQYEIGPDNGGGSTVNVANRIRANRLPEMKNLILHDALRWFQSGGDMYIYFAAPGAYSRYGCWGLSEDIRDLRSPKWQAIYELTGYPPPR